MSGFPMPEDFEDDGTPVVGEVEGTPSEDDGSVSEPTQEVSTETPEVDDDGGQTESTDTPESNVLNIDEFGDRMVTIKVDGEDLTVPLSEALSGYSRTEDYTRKRQRDAELVKAGEAFQALQQKLADNPDEVLEALSSRYGKQTAPAATSTEETAESNLDPQIQFLVEREQARIQAEQDQLLESTLEGFEAFDPKFDRGAFVKDAVQAGITEIADLEAFYKVRAFDQMVAGQQANTQHQAASAADDQARQAAAQAAGELQSGAGVAGGSTAPTTFDSFEDAFEAAVAASGGWD